MQSYVIALIVIGGFAVYLAIVMVCLYEKGCLVKIHPMNKHKEGQIKVACVGDSITYGSYHLTKRNYPAVLSKMLGDEYCVNNFGFSGAHGYERRRYALCERQELSTQSCFYA